MRNDFEAAATHLLPYDLVQKKRADQAVGKRGAAVVSDVTGEEGNVSSLGTKKRGGASGVPLHCHTKQEHNLLYKKRRTNSKSGGKVQFSKERRTRRVRNPTSLIQQRLLRLLLRRR
jgi:hypothetical protein